MSWTRDRELRTMHPMSQVARPAPSRRLPPGRLLRDASALIVIGLVVWGWIWWSHPSLIQFSENGYEATEPLARATESTSIALPPSTGTKSETITFKSANAHFASNTADATAAFSVCVRKPASEVVGAVLASDLPKYCSQVLPIRGGTEMLWADGDPVRQYVLITLRPTKTGYAHVDGVTIDYARSWKHLHQQGRQHSPLDVSIRVKG